MANSVFVIIFVFRSRLPVTQSEKNKRIMFFCNIKTVINQNLPVAGFDLLFVIYLLV